MTRTIVKLIEEFSSREGTAIVHNGETMSYREFYNKLNAVASHLTKNYQIDDEPVVISSESKYQQILGIYGVIYAGGIAVPVSSDATSETVNRVFEATESRVALGTDREVGADNIIELEDIPKGNREFNLRSQKEGEAALILFTSGTTGKKKGVELSHGNLMKTSNYINEFMGVEKPITEHVLVPIHHSFGFARTRCVFLVGGTVVLDDGQFNPLLALKRMKSFDCSAFSGVPSVMAMLIRTGEDRFATIGEQIEFVEIGSAPMPKEHKGFLISNLPNANICMHYGLTEASRTCFIDFRQEQNKLDSVGRPSPGVSVKIVDDSGQELPPGVLGEIAVSGPNVARGYVMDENQEFKEWFNTGDVGYKDEDEYVYFRGRSDNVINVGGEKISAIDIENKIKNIENEVDEYCVVGKSKQEGIYTEVPVLCTTDSEFTELELQTLNKQLNQTGLKEIFLPREIHTIEEIPKTHNGKIRRVELKDQIVD